MVHRNRIPNVYFGKQCRIPLLTSRVSECFVKGEDRVDDEFLPSSTLLNLILIASESPPPLFILQLSPCTLISILEIYKFINWDLDFQQLQRR